MDFSDFLGKVFAAAGFAFGPTVARRMIRYFFEEMFRNSSADSRDSDDGRDTFSRRR
jgi:hypothetical protein